MKRCPQCEFIYEDDQSLCDMDGVLLVLDSRSLPSLHALATVPPVPKSHRRNRAVPAFASLILALVLGTVYYVLTQRSADIPPIETSTSIAIPVALPPTPAVETNSPAQPAKEEEAAAAKPEPIKAPVKKATAKSATASQTKPATREKKEDSKVNSILKKTGRILKKPFKF